MLTLYPFSFHAMGTDCVLHLCAINYETAQFVAGAAIDEVRRIERRYSRYRADSDLAAINRVADRGGMIEVDDETGGLLSYAFAAYRKSAGLFDISSGLLRRSWDFKAGRLPHQAELDELLPRIGLDKVVWESPRLTFLRSGMELDFGGIGKEYAADRAADICLALGVEHGVIDLGGDIHVIGPTPRGEPWQIGIRHPSSPGEVMAVVQVEHGSVATSGDYERFIEVEGRRFSHILNPRTGWPVQGLRSVTVVTDRCLVAGSVSTIAMLKGYEGTRWIKGLGLEYCTADVDGRLDHTTAFCVAV
jgi:FAD:protein FMN transferase